MAVFALVHGGAGTAALWDGVADDLSRLGHEAIAMDLPADDPEAGWGDYARAAEEFSRVWALLDITPEELAGGRAS